MESPAPLAGMEGRWKGTNWLQVSPDQDAITSLSRADVKIAAKGRFVVISYEWAIEQEQHDGMLVCPCQQGDMSPSAWLDSWHTPDGIMACQSHIDGSQILLQGSYPAPSGPDWGWKILVETPTRKSLKIQMTNVSPSGEEYLAVVLGYER